MKDDRVCWRIGLRSYASSLGVCRQRLYFLSHGTTPTWLPATGCMTERSTRALPRWTDERAESMVCIDGVHRVVVCVAIVAVILTLTPNKSYPFISRQAVRLWRNVGLTQ